MGSMSSPVTLASWFPMRTAKAAILSVVALIVPGPAAASTLLLDTSLSPAPEAIASSPGLDVNAARSLSCVDTTRFQFAPHAGAELEIAHAAAKPAPHPENLNAAAKPQRGVGTYGMPLAGLALLGFIARRRHRVLNASD